MDETREDSLTKHVTSGIHDAMMLRARTIFVLVQSLCLLRDMSSERKGAR